MQLTYFRGTYVSTSEYSEREILKKAGLKWQPALRRWVTTNARVAACSGNIADFGARTAMADAGMDVKDAVRRAVRQQAKEIKRDARIVQECRDRAVTLLEITQSVVLPKFPRPRSGVEELVAPIASMHMRLRLLRKIAVVDCDPASCRFCIVVWGYVPFELKAFLRAQGARWDPRPRFYIRWLGDAPDALLPAIEQACAVMQHRTVCLSPGPPAPPSNWVR